jgi:hypothetical protein
MYFAMLLFWTTILLAVVVSLLTKPIPEYRVSETHSAVDVMTEYLKFVIQRLSFLSALKQCYHLVNVAYVFLLIYV